MENQEQYDLNTIGKLVFQMHTVMLGNGTAENHSGCIHERERNTNFRLSCGKWATITLRSLIGVLLVGIISGGCWVGVKISNEQNNTHSEVVSNGSNTH